MSVIFLGPDCQSSTWGSQLQLPRRRACEYDYCASETIDSGMTILKIGISVQWLYCKATIGVQHGTELDDRGNSSPSRGSPLRCLSEDHSSRPTRGVSILLAISISSTAATLPLATGAPE